MSLIFQKMLFFSIIFFYDAGVYPFSFAENENLRPNLGGESDRERAEKPTDKTKTAVSPFIGFIDAACLYA